jgi:hypothetical protein
MLATRIDEEIFSTKPAPTAIVTALREAGTLAQRKAEHERDE